MGIHYIDDLDECLMKFNGIDNSKR